MSSIDSIFLLLAVFLAANLAYVDKARRAKKHSDQRENNSSDIGKLLCPPGISQRSSWKNASTLAVPVRKVSAGDGASAWKLKESELPELSLSADAPWAI